MFLFKSAPSEGSGGTGSKREHPGAVPVASDALEGLPGTEGRQNSENKVGISKRPSIDTPWALRSLPEATPKIDDGHEFFRQL